MQYFVEVYLKNISVFKQNWGVASSVVLVFLTLCFLCFLHWINSWTLRFIAARCKKKRNQYMCRSRTKKTISMYMQHQSQIHVSCCGCWSAFEQVSGCVCMIVSQPGVRGQRTVLFSLCTLRIKSKMSKIKSTPQD